MDRWLEGDSNTKEDKALCSNGRTILSSIILALAATKMLRRGYEAFLAHVVSVESNLPDLANISMVHRFLNIFF